ncbi:MAG: copper chaperone PCu(A)C [Xanthomonadales bacterium]|nr:copper chaperone PCu(A)C [Xanthomonadales bacterium]
MIPRLVLASLALLVSSAACAAGHISASHAWIRLLPGSLPAAAYVVLHNDSDTAIRLTGASSDAFGMIMLHQSTHKDGMAHMGMVSAMDIPAHAIAALAPAGYHLMLTQPTHALRVGDQVTLSLKFADGSQLSVPFKLRPANASSDVD